MTGYSESPLSSEASCYTAEQILHHPELLKKIPVNAQSEAQCLAAVQANGLALQHVHKQTPDICRAAIEQVPHALRFVETQTQELCWAALRKSSVALDHIKKQSPLMCLEVVRQDGMALEYVKQQTPEICLAAVQHCGWALEHVKAQTPEICLAAVQNQGLALEFVHDQTPDICMAALQNDGVALMYMKQQTLEFCLAAVRSESLALEHVVLPMDKLAVPGSGQLQAWRKLLKACGPVDRECVGNALFPLMAAIPLGKQHGEEWCQVLPDGLTAMDGLIDLAGELARIAPDVQEVNEFVHRVHQQQEWILRQQLNSRCGQSDAPAFTEEMRLTL